MNDRLLEGKRVVFVLPSLEIGGAERQALLLARYLFVEQKANVTYWGLTDQPGKAVDELAGYGIPWRVFPFQWSNTAERLRFLLRFATALRQTQPDVIVSYTLTANVACGLVWRWTGARLSIWNQRGINDFPIGKHFESWAVRGTPIFISNSTFWADFLLRHYRLAPTKVSVIHNGVELPEESPQTNWRRQFGIDENAFVVCMVANLTEYKDHPTLIRAWHRVIQELEHRGQSAMLVLAGSIWSTGDSIRQLIASLNMDKYVRIVGFVSDVPGLLREVDLGVLVSNSEGLSNAVLESMAAGLPVVATDIPGVREAIGPDYPYLVPPGSVDQLAERILLFAQDSKLRKKIGAENRERVQREFSVQKMCETTAGLIATRLQSRSGV